VACGIGWVSGYNVSENLNAAIDGFAPGALLVMLIPEAVRKGGDVAGLVTGLR